MVNRGAQFLCLEFGFTLVNSIGEANYYHTITPILTTGQTGFLAQLICHNNCFTIKLQRYEYHIWGDGILDG